MADDFPCVVVQGEVVERAEQDAVVDVGGAVVVFPVVDVVGFGPGCGSVAAGPHAAAVAGGEGDALFAGEAALLSSNIQRPGVCDGDSCGGASAGQAFQSVRADRVGLSLNETVTAGTSEGVHCGQHPDHRTAGPQQFAVVDGRRGLDEVQEGIGGQLCRSAVISGDSVGVVLVRAGHESRTSPPRRRRTVEDLQHCRGRLRIQQPDQLHHAVGLPVDSERPLCEPTGLTVGDTCLIDVVARLSGEAMQAIGVEVARVGSERRGHRREHVFGNSRRRHSQSGRDRLRARDSECAVGDCGADRIQPGPLRVSRHQSPHTHGSEGFARGRPGDRAHHRLGRSMPQALRKPGRTQLRSRAERNLPCDRS
nr:hypothetical protein [Glaciihabitans arcticus]